MNLYSDKSNIEDIENILENIRYNSVIMSEQHKVRYLYLKGILRYFRIPIIILSGINSVISVGLQPYMGQGLISVLTCLVSLTCGIIGSIELYLSIQAQMENELVTSKEYYLLSIEIYKLLSLNIMNRNIDIKTFMEEKFSHYQKLIEKSNIIVNNITDKLTQTPGIRQLQDKYINTGSSIGSSTPIVPDSPLRDLNIKQDIRKLYTKIYTDDNVPQLELNITKPTIEIPQPSLSINNDNQELATININTTNNDVIPSSEEVSLDNTNNDNDDNEVV